MKKIYYITNMFPSETKKDNYGVFCKKVYDGLDDSELKISLFSAIKGKSFNKIYNLFRYFCFIFDIWFKIIFCKSKFDAIYFQYVWLHVVCALPFFNFLKKKNKKIIINFHGEDLLSFVNNPEKKIYKKILLFSDLIIFPSEYYKNWLISKFDVSKEKLFVSASGGIDKSVFAYKKMNTLGNTIVFCSRFTEYKGWRDFIDAINILIKKEISCQAVMIGYGEDFQKILARISELNLNDVITVKTRLSHKEISNIYKNSNLFLFTTTTTESLGLVALEAMSCGLPVIGTKIAALPEYIHDGENGFLVDTHSPEQLAKAVEKYFYFNTEEKERIITKALLTSENYETRFVVNKLKERIKDVLYE